MKKIIASLFAVMFLSACAGGPVPRQELSKIPFLDSGMARMTFTSGHYGPVKIWANNQIGPVKINGRRVGTTAANEYFIVDLKPGVYDVSCEPNVSEKNYVRHVPVTVSAGEVRNFACDLHTKGAGAFFGVIGALASEYLTETVPEEKPLTPTDKAVEYVLF